MEPKIVERQPATVACLRHVGPYDGLIERFWRATYVPWAVASGLAPDHARYGIAHDDPTVTPPGECRYDACAEVAPGYVPTGGAFLATIPGGRYAVLRFTGTAAQAGAAWDALLHDWLPASSLRFDASRPRFEYYPAGDGFDPETGTFSCRLCVPVVPR